MPTNINTNYLSFQSLVARGAPDARLLATGGIDFTSDTTYNLDLTATVQSAQLEHPLQAVYIDCSGIAFGVTTLTIFGTGQRISVAAGAQGYYPLFMPSRSYVFSLANTQMLGQSRANGTAYLLFANIPVVASEWNAFTSSGAGGNVNLIQPVRTVTAGTDTATLADFTLLCNAASNTITEYLPASLSTNQTALLNVFKTDATANVVTVNGNGSMIETASTYLLYGQHSGVQLQWTGGIWKLLGEIPGLWANWTTLVTASGSMTVSGTAIAVGQFVRDRSFLHYELWVSFTLGGAASNFTYLTLPVVCASTNNIIQQSPMIVMGGVGYAGIGWVNNNTLFVAPSGPLNWTLGSAEIRLTGTYRIA